jgi:hypothetical protein
LKKQIGENFVNVPCALKEWQNFFLDEQVDLWMKLTAP